VLTVLSALLEKNILSKVLPKVSPAGMVTRTSNIAVGLNVTKKTYSYVPSTRTLKNSMGGIREYGHFDERNIFDDLDEIGSL
jgi:hypothetical protein